MFWFEQIYLDLKSFILLGFIRVEWERHFSSPRFTEPEAIKLTNPSEIFHETVVAKRGSIVILKNASFKQLRSVFRPLGLTALDLYGFDRSWRCRRRSRWCTFQQNILIYLLTSQFSQKPLNTAKNLAGKEADLKRKLWPNSSWIKLVDWTHTYHVTTILTFNESWS